MYSIENIRQQLVAVNVDSVVIGVSEAIVFGRGGCVYCVT